MAVLKLPSKIVADSIMATPQFYKSQEAVKLGVPVISADGRLEYHHNWGKDALAWLEEFTISVPGAEVIKSEGDAMDNINVKALGAKGDGIADDSSIIQNAFDNYANVYIPCGKYKITKPLIFKGNSTFYGGGYVGRNLTMDRGTILYPYDDIDVLIAKGSNMRIAGGVLSCEPMMKTYSKTLFTMTALDADVGANQACYNIIDGLYCVNGNMALFNEFTGTGIRMVNDGANAMYGNRFVNCYVADLHYGLKIENKSTAGINANTFDMGLWNCNCLGYIKGGGNIFSGNWQCGNPGIDTEMPAFDVYAGSNNFLGMMYDVGNTGTNKYAYRFNEKAGYNVVLQYLPKSTLILNGPHNTVNTDI